MKTFNDWVQSLQRQPYGALPWFEGVHYALEALAAERAAERERRAEYPRCMPFGTKCASNCTAAFGGPCGRTQRGYGVGVNRPSPIDAATARVAAAREAAPEPVSVEPGHWGMHA